MKKIIPCLLALSICLTLAACGKDENVTSSEAPEVSSAVPVSTETELEALVKEDTFREQVLSLSASYEDKGMKIDVFAEGKKVVYTCTYTVDIDVDKAKQELAEYLDGKTMTSQFESTLKSFRNQVPETEALVVRYIDKSGNIIVSKEYQ